MALLSSLLPQSLSSYASSWASGSAKQQQQHSTQQPSRHIRSSSLSPRSLVALVLSLTAVANAQVCATFNTGDDSTLNVSIYQSNGLCQGTCSGYAYAIVQDKQCWCSNFAPATSNRVSASSCSDSCPGYPSDQCGSLANNYYYYILLSNPSGTITQGGGSSSSTSTTSSSSSSDVSSAVQSSTSSDSSSSTTTSTTTSQTSETTTSSTETSTSTSTTSTSITSTSTTSTSTTSSSTIETSSTSSTPTPSPSLIISVLTVTGSPQTLTITQHGSSTSASSTPDPTSFSSVLNAQSSTSSTTADAQQESPSATVVHSNSFFSNKGAVAGVFTVVGILIVLLICLLFYFCYRYRQRKQAEAGGGILGQSPSGKGSPSSFLDSKTNMHFLGFGGGAKGRNESFSEYGGVGIAAGGMGGRGGSRSTAAGGLSRDNSGSSLDEKMYGGSSTIVPLEVDQRLDPGAVYMRWDHNDSRKSLQDEHDYSRKVLRVINPDHGRDSSDGMHR